MVAKYPCSQPKIVETCDFVVVVCVLEIMNEVSSHSNAVSTKLVYENS